MPQRSINSGAELYASPSRWSLELAPGWAAQECVEHSRDERLPYVVVRPRSGDAELRLTTFDPGRIAAAAWVRTCAEINRLKNRPVVPVRFGVFSGCATEFASGGVLIVGAADWLSGEGWIRGWALHAGPFPLDVTYRCPLSLAGRDDMAVEAMLCTLYLRGLPA
jgi:hypothetical protein